MFSGFCHFQPLDLSPSFSTSGRKNIPRDLVTRNFLNLNEFWEFVKMCETSPKVNRGKFLKALVSHHLGHRHWTYKVAKTTKSEEIHWGNTMGKYTGEIQ